MWLYVDQGQYSITSANFRQTLRSTYAFKRIRDTRDFAGFYDTEVAQKSLSDFLGIYRAKFSWLDHFFCRRAASSHYINHLL